jgi:hypothetical protein
MRRGRTAGTIFLLPIFHSARRILLICRSLKEEEELILKRITAGLAGSLILMLLAGTVNVFAAGGTADPGQDRTGSIAINYYDDADGKKSIPDAKFRAVKVGELEDGLDVYPFTSVIPGITINETTKASDIADTVKNYTETGRPVVSYELKTDQNGLASVSGVEPGVYYLEETAAAPNHRASEPVLLTIPYMEEDGSAWKYDALIAPKPVRTGDLRITKTVGGNAGDRKIRFRFTVALGEEGKFSYTSSDGRSGSVSSGDTLELADGESVLISGLLEGTEYKVSEVRANMDGYTTESENSEGRIVYAKAAECRFRNTKNSVPTGSGGSSAGGSKAGSVKTGDYTDAMIPSILLFLSGGILAAAGLFYGRRRSN